MKSRKRTAMQPLAHMTPQQAKAALTEFGRGRPLCPMTGSSGKNKIQYPTIEEAEHARDLSARAFPKEPRHETQMCQWQTHFHVVCAPRRGQRKPRGAEVPAIEQIRTSYCPTR
jgi:hypothetical protein